MNLTFEDATVIDQAMSWVKMEIMCSQYSLRKNSFASLWRNINITRRQVKWSSSWKVLKLPSKIFFWLVPCDFLSLTIRHMWSSKLMMCSKTWQRKSAHLSKKRHLFFYDAHLTSTCKCLVFQLNSGWLQKKKKWMAEDLATSFLFTCGLFKALSPKAWFDRIYCLVFLAAIKQ